jgi:formylmethanofuran dehydrogenase subunit C
MNSMPLTLNIGSFPNWMGTDSQDNQNTVTLKLKEELTSPLEAETISPDMIGTLENEEIRALPVFSGKKKRHLGDFFEVKGERSFCLEMFGNMARVKWIGCGMTRGRIVIHGSTGMHVGAYMSGGAIIIYGDTSDWLGAEMTGGRIFVRGRTGGQVGGAYRGSMLGMQGGEILIDGMAGIEVGRRMGGGIISILGRVGDFAGLEMTGGALFLFGNAGLRTGAWMSKGTIIAYQPIVLLPTFLRTNTYSPDYMQPSLKHLQGLGLSIPEKAWSSSYQCFTGDTSEAGDGEILICQTPVMKVEADAMLAANPVSENQVCG